MEKKEYKTYRQLITKLRGRGMYIPKGSVGSRVIRILEKENYYNVINGYKALFIDKPSTEVEDEKYINGTTFDEVYALYNFDRELRMIYLKYLLKIENSFKTVIAHSFSEVYGHDNYLKMSSFNCDPTIDVRELKNIAKTNNLKYPEDLKRIKQISAGNKIASVTKLIGDIQKEVSRQMNNNHEVVTHYMTNHGYIPLWVLVNVLTFGKITNFYLNLKETDKINIAKNFNINYKELHKYMKILGLSRNKCAHDERFFDLKFRSNLHMNSIKNISVLKLRKDKSGSYLSGNNDIFAIAIIFSQMLKKSDVKEFISLIDGALKKIEKQIKTVNIDTIMNCMGYPENWKDVIKLVR